MLARLRPVVAALLAVSLAAPAHAAEPCPGERADADAETNLGHCLVDAREARKTGQSRLAAAAYARAAALARTAYDAGKLSAAAEWFTDAGEQVVFYGTEGCATTTTLGPEQARGVLGACIELLDTYLADLAAIDAGATKSAEAARRRRSELQPVLDALPADAPTPEPPPTTTATTPPVTPLVTPLVTPTPDARPVHPIVPPRPPRGLNAALGTSAGVAGLAIVGLVGAGVLGRDASDAVLASPEANTVMTGDDVCGAEPRANGCKDLATSKGLFIASGVLLGLALAATAVLVGLRVRHGRAKPGVRAARAPIFGGPTAGFAVRF